MLRYFIFGVLLVASIGCNKSERNLKNYNPNLTNKKDLKKLDITNDIKNDLIKISEGYDFVAGGESPFWSLEIDFEKVIRFRSDTNVKILNTPAVKGTKAQDADVIRYHAQTEAGEIFITIFGELCSEQNSTLYNMQEVMVQVKSSLDNDFTELNGCGRYLMNYRLNDIWVLEKMTGVNFNDKIETLEKGLPVFEFHLKDKKFLGHAGCNNIRSSLLIEGDKIKFGRIFSDKNTCSNMNLEKKVISALSEKVFNYKFDNRKLNLISTNDVIMELKKID